MGLPALRPGRRYRARSRRSRPAACRRALSPGRARARGPSEARPRDSPFASERSASSSKRDLCLALRCSGGRTALARRRREPRPAEGASRSSACSSAGVRCGSRECPAEVACALQELQRRDADRGVDAQIDERRGDHRELAAVVDHDPLARSRDPHVELGLEQETRRGVGGGPRSRRARAGRRARGRSTPRRAPPAGATRPAVRRLSRREHARSLPRGRPGAPRSGCAPLCGARGGDPPPRARTPRRPGRVASRTRPGRGSRCSRAPAATRGARWPRTGLRGAAGAFRTASSRGWSRSASRRRRSRPSAGRRG